MPGTGGNRDDDDGTLIGFRPDAGAPRPGTPAPAFHQDEDATIVRRGTEDEGSSDRTVVAGAAPRQREVTALAWLAITRTRTVRYGDIFRLDKPRLIIGRGEDVDIFLDDSLVGSSHAAIKVEVVPRGVPEFILCDLASTNGTYLNGQRVLAPVAMKDGDRIVLGETELVFKKV